jgi:diguanylate cyclase (GGDEF)-like protein
VESNNKPTIQFLKVSTLQSIKTKILIFALLATIVPSLILGSLSYLQNSKMLQAKLTGTMRNATVQAAGKFDLWLKERMYDLRVFASSYVISENVTHLAAGGTLPGSAMTPSSLIKGYLQSICDKFAVYDELILIDPDGTPMVTSAESGPALRLPEAWKRQISAAEPIKAETLFDRRTGLKYGMIAETIKTGDGRALGFLAAKINLDSIRSILQRHAVGGIDEIYLVDAKRRLLVSSHPLTKPLLRSNRSVTIPQIRNNTSTMPASYTDFREQLVVGTAIPVTAIDWAMVAQMKRVNAYAELVLLRRITAALVTGLMLGIGILAYLFGHTLVRPVRRLSEEATRVAGGNLDVDIPVAGLSEVSYLTQVFNHMVSSLRYGREKLSDANKALLETNKELHHLSITDGLTGLLNRKHISDQLDREISRYKRYGYPVSILMLDIDYFKNVNDTYGHQTGDLVMRRLADLFCKAIRENDMVGRYGGEEFLILLPDCNAQSAVQTAQRIRKMVQILETESSGKNVSVTVSIGVSSCPQYGQDADTLICAADAALYQAKSNGRNQVVLAKTNEHRQPAVVHMLAEHKRPGGYTL